tara:strand:- start:384 stop:959 length:576 start_codon:yes stop_codon:yes gene_type:complete
MRISSLALFSSALFLILTSCGGKDDQAENTIVPDSSASSALDSILLSEAPEGSVDITKARQNPIPGTKVILSGKVMGNVNPIIQSRALLTLGDPAKITSCDLIPGDDCKTPWDVCCADPDIVNTSIATIQVLDENGQPIKAGLRGIGGLRELSTLIIVGEVAEASNENNFLVNATGIHVATAQAAGNNSAK